LSSARDNRGFFARTFCVEEFAAHGLETNYPQHSISFSTRKGTAARHAHISVTSYSEAKIGPLHSRRHLDVIIDIRPDSSTFRRWQAFELSSVNGPPNSTFPKGSPTDSKRSGNDVEVTYLILRTI